MSMPVGHPSKTLSPLPLLADDRAVAPPASSKVAPAPAAKIEIREAADGEIYIDGATQARFNLGYELSHGQADAECAW